MRRNVGTRRVIRHGGPKLTLHGFSPRVAHADGHAISVFIAQRFAFGNGRYRCDGVINALRSYIRLGAEAARSVAHHSIDVGYDMPKHLCLRS